jgi:hypothetical protein
MSLKSVRGRTTAIGPAKLYTAPLPLNAANYAGAWAFSDGRMSYSDGVSWNELFANVTVLRTVTVGSVSNGSLDGDFPTIGAALSYFAGFSPSADVYDFLGKIVILDNYVVTEQIQMFSQNLGWVAIESETPFVDIDVDVSTFAITDVFVPFRPFMSFVNGTAPIIRCRFKSVGTAPIEPATGAPWRTIGLILRTCFFATIDEDPLPADPPATNYVFRTAFDGFFENIRVGANATARITCMEFKNATDVNVSVSAGRLTFLRGRIRGSTGPQNVFVGNGSIATIGFSDFQRTQGVNSASDLVLIGGSIASIVTASTLGGISENEVVPSGNGIVFDSRSAVTPTWEGFIKPQAFTVATLPVASAYTGSMVYVSDETGGATVAFSDGTDWRRVQDRNIVS